MPNYWKLRGNIARIELPQLSGEVDPAYPWRGFSPSWTKQLGVAILKADLGLQASDQPETLVDLYERGADLVATYAQSPERSFRPQIYWRYVAERVHGQEIHGLEVIVSAQTSLLDSLPQTIVESMLPACELLTLETSPATLVLLRPPTWQMSYCQMVLEQDLSAAEPSAVGALTGVRWRLFNERLEKGVLRRGRVRGFFLPREADQDLARVCCEAFVRSPLVLST